MLLSTEIVDFSNPEDIETDSNRRVTDRNANEMVQTILIIDQENAIVGNGNRNERRPARLLEHREHCTAEVIADDQHGTINSVDFSFGLHRGRLVWLGSVASCLDRMQGTNQMDDASQGSAENDGNRCAVLCLTLRSLVTKLRCVETKSAVFCAVL